MGKSGQDGARQEQFQVRFGTALNGALNAALCRLKSAPSGAAPEIAENASRDGVAADPTRTHFPSAGGGRQESASDALSLNIMLEDSASDIVRRADALHQDANRLIARIGERIEGEITLQAQGARALISFIWLGVGVWLYISALNAQAAGQTTLAGGVPVGDAFVLMRAFFIVGAVGLGVAFAISALANALGRGNNNRVRVEAEALGGSIADTAMEFDRTLTSLRTEMDRRAAAGDAVIDLSRAHMTALEACAYFRRMPFLTALDAGDAEASFRRFLFRPSVNPPPLPVFISGALFSFLIFYLFLYPRPAPTEPSAELAILQYPWALALVGIGAVVYAVIGLLFSIMPGAVAGGAAAKAHAEALDALRGAFTAREAPRPADITRRIEDAVDVFRARVNTIPRNDLEAGANQPDSARADFTAEDGAVPAWRRRDSSVRFVDAGFQAAPQQWRTDAGAPSDSGEPETKRGFFGLKKPARD